MSVHVLRELKLRQDNCIVS